MEILKENWEMKLMHGQYPESVKIVDADKEGTHKQLKSASLKGETGGFIVTAQDQSLATNNYRDKIIKDGTTQNADYVTNIMKPQNTLYQDVQFWQKRNTLKDMAKR